ncbi:hypothetical protein H6P81_018616 [Aristolochia fimbriata]|uniref:Prolamin-like domain-containing protein n=1 Tax=Aristolochia fimbriata TaxID=158543 RepID=A0AAV7E1U6_ARIFI|nr:hypothetical protein H6P81_018615 [Aristolochia fimbriata]KAG9442762.1 hypothetical protein H6P81_018616 [Aristolochia fimbriata]
MVKGTQLTVILVLGLAAFLLPAEAILHFREPTLPVYNFTEFKKCDKIFKAVAGEAFRECATAILSHLTSDTFSFSQACCKAENAVSNLPCWKDSVEYFSPVIPKWYSVLIKDYCASGKAPTTVPKVPIAEAPSP